MGQQRGSIRYTRVKLFRPQLNLGQRQRPSQHIRHKFPQPRLHKSRPRLGILLRRSDYAHAQIMGISNKEIRRLKQLLPNLSALHLLLIQNVPPLKVLIQLIHNDMPPAKLLMQNLQRLSTHAQRRVHRRIRGRDHRRHLPHRRRLVRIPHRQTQLGIVGLRQHDGIRPPPRFEHQKELPQQTRRTGVRIELQYQRHGHVDVDPTPISHFIRVQSPAFGPFTYEPDHRQEGLISLFRPAH
mmetsp:Transcript_19310/g.34768  ORF Transcript_19310/g.34768 Transcript_19310/m.34768 type:complete len:240 (+) Transcript_19310:1132-1851(+)